MSALEGKTGRHMLAESFPVLTPSCYPLVDFAALHNGIPTAMCEISSATYPSLFVLLGTGSSRPRRLSSA
jgi:hypothetical protein